MAGDMRREINELKESVGRIDSTLNRVMAVVANIAGTLGEMKAEMRDSMATKKDISDLNSRMDGFSGLLLDSRHRWAVHAETLVNHDERLKKLEAPRA